MSIQPYQLEPDHEYSSSEEAEEEPVDSGEEEVLSQCIELFTAKSTTIIEDFSILKRLTAKSHLLIRSLFRQFLNRLSYCKSREVLFFIEE